MPTSWYLSLLLNLGISNPVYAICVCLESTNITGKVTRGMFVGVCDDGRSMERTSSTHCVDAARKKRNAKPYIITFLD